MAKKASQKQKMEVGRDIEYDDICFVISPIGKENSDIYNHFKEVLDYVIKPAIESVPLKLRIVRADDINRSGSFIKDILNHIYSSFIVIADLTNQNPNVFYELGVRHALSARTVLLAQKLDDVPSDLREYRTIIYDTSAKGSQKFKKKITQYIEEMKKEPHRPDNPVLDRLPNLTENKQADLEDQISKLKSQLTTVLSKAQPKKQMQKKQESADIAKRMNRILKLLNAEYQSIGGGKFTRKEGEETKSYSLETEQGNFRLYFLNEKNSTSIKDFWYVSIDHYGHLNIEEELADIRVLMERCAEGQEVQVKFIITTDEDLKGQKQKIRKAFNRIKSFIEEEYRSLFELELFDLTGLVEIEKELGIRVQV